MKRLTISLTILTILISSMSQSENSASEEGRKIIEMVDKTNHPESELVEMTMKLIDQAGKERIRYLILYSKKDKRDNLKTLIRFTKPRDIEGTGLLTIEHEDRNDDQWLYLPILRKSKRIAPMAKTHNFVGTDFTFEDLRPEKSSVYNYKLLGTPILNGEECYLLEATPKSKKDEEVTGYSKRRLWIRKDILLIIRVEYYNKEGKFFKIRSDSNIEEIKNNLWQANMVIMENYHQKHKTILTIEKRKINEDIDENRFTLRELERKDDYE